MFMCEQFTCSRRFLVLEIYLHISAQPTHPQGVGVHPPSDADGMHMAVVSSGRGNAHPGTNRLGLKISETFSENIFIVI